MLSWIYCMLQEWAEEEESGVDIEESTRAVEEKNLMFFRSNSRNWNRRLYRSKWGKVLKVLAKIMENGKCTMLE